MTATGTYVGFGDLMLSLATPGHTRLVQASSFDVRYTGAEANVAVMLSQLGLPTRVASRVPEHAIGQACINALRHYGVDTTPIARGGDRLGLLYLETGAAQRASSVEYDRANSSFATSGPDDYDWDTILDGAAWLHFSGTAPSFGASVRAALREGLQEAHRRGVTTSCDLNYRAKLWSPEEAQQTMARLAGDVDVLFGNEEDAVKVLGARAPGSDVTSGDLPHESYRLVAEELAERYGFRAVATSLRTSVSASINHWAGMLYDGSTHSISRSYEINPIVDRVGGGDSYAAGIIFGLLQSWDSQDCVEYAAAASCLKHSIPGDFNVITPEEVDALRHGDGSGRVRR